MRYVMPISLCCLGLLLLLGGCAQLGGAVTRPQPSGPDANFETAKTILLNKENPSWNESREKKFYSLLGQAEQIKSNNPKSDALRKEFEQLLNLRRVIIKGNEPGLPKQFVNSIGITMKLIDSNSPYYIGVYEITDDQWSKVMEGGGGAAPANWISYDEAEEFCRKLLGKEGLTYSLPTETQWEYACRAGTTTAYSFGDSWSSSGRNKPNPWGLYDMHGNLFEWCKTRVLRGGCWANFPQHCHSAFRVRTNFGSQSIEYGFRIVLYIGHVDLP